MNGDDLLHTCPPSPRLASPRLHHHLSFLPSLSDFKCSFIIFRMPISACNQGLNRVTRFTLSNFPQLNEHLRETT